MPTLVQIASTYQKKTGELTEILRGAGYTLQAGGATQLTVNHLRVIDHACNRTPAAPDKPGKQAPTRIGRVERMKRATKWAEVVELNGGARYHLLLANKRLRGLQMGDLVAFRPSVDVGTGRDMAGKTVALGKVHVSKVARYLYRLYEQPTVRRVLRKQLKAADLASALHDDVRDLLEHHRQPGQGELERLVEVYGAWLEEDAWGAFDYTLAEVLAAVSAPLPAVRWWLTHPYTRQPAEAVLLSTFYDLPPTDQVRALNLADDTVAAALLTSYYHEFGYRAAFEVIAAADDARFELRAAYPKPTPPPETSEEDSDGNPAPRPKKVRFSSLQALEDLLAELATVTASPPPNRRHRVLLPSGPRYVSTAWLEGNLDQVTPADMHNVLAALAADAATEPTLPPPLVRRALLRDLLGPDLPWRKQRAKVTVATLMNVAGRQKIMDLLRWLADYLPATDLYDWWREGLLPDLPDDRVISAMLNTAQQQQEAGFEHLLDTLEGLVAKWDLPTSQATKLLRGALAALPDITGGADLYFLYEGRQLLNHWAADQEEATGLTPINEHYLKALQWVRGEDTATPDFAAATGLFNCLTLNDQQLLIERLYATAATTDRLNQQLIAIGSLMGPAKFAFHRLPGAGRPREIDLSPFLVQLTIHTLAKSRRFPQPKELVSYLFNDVVEALPEVQRLFISDGPLPCPGRTDASGQTHDRPGGVTFCQGQLAPTSAPTAKGARWSCAGKDCYAHARTVTTADDSLGPLYHLLVTLGVPLGAGRRSGGYEQAEYFHDYVRRVNEFITLLGSLVCDDCKEWLGKANSSKKVGAGRVWGFLCQNTSCSNEWTVLLETCTQPGCGWVRDSRRSHRCPHGRLICANPRCGACCSQLEYDRKHQRLLADNTRPPDWLHRAVIEQQGHLERGIRFCYYCGEEMDFLGEGRYECPSCQTAYHTDKGEAAGAE